MNLYRNHQHSLRFYISIKSTHKICHRHKSLQNRQNQAKPLQITQNQNSNLNFTNVQNQQQNTPEFGQKQQQIAIPNRPYKNEFMIRFPKKKLSFKKIEEIKKSEHVVFRPLIQKTNKIPESFFAAPIKDHKQTVRIKLHSHSLKRYQQVQKIEQILLEALRIKANNINFTKNVKTEVQSRKLKRFFQ